MSTENKLKDGGRAFPHLETTSRGEPFFDHLGMSLRDYFAAKAMVALPHIGCGCDLDNIDFAKAAYQLADAMLAEREK